MADTINAARLTNQISIEKRPPIVDKKSRLGDWEIDTLLGKRPQREAIVSMTERRSKLLRIQKISRRTGKLVKDAVCQKLNGLTVHTLTSDNGREFSEHASIARTLDASFFFCHPYASWERGLNENTNGLLRQYFPKKTLWTNITDNQIAKVQESLNNRPRKTLGYQTPMKSISKNNCIYLKLHLLLEFKSGYFSNSSCFEVLFSFFVCFVDNLFSSTQYTKRII